jgi:hypothetical protein
MTLAYNLPFMAYALKYINNCRLILNVISIADLNNASGKYVASEMYQIKRNSSITCKVDQVDNIPIDSFPCVINLRNEIISEISDNCIEQTICEHKTYVDEEIIAVTDASVIGERGA